MKFNQTMALLAAAGLLIPVVARSEHKVASYAYIPAYDSSMVSQTDYDYDAHGNVIKTKYTYPYASQYDFYTERAFTYLSGDLWSKIDAHSYYNDGRPDNHTVSYYEYDGQNRLIKHSSIYADTLRYDYYIDYTDFEQGLLVKSDTYKLDPLTHEEKELEQRTTTVFFKALGRYLQERQSKTYQYHVTDDSIEEKRYDEAGVLSYLNVNYYDKTERIGNRTWNYERWSGDMTETQVDSVARLKTEIRKTVDEATGAWLNVSKVESTIDIDEPMKNGYIYRYTWNSDAGNWNRYESYTYTWINRMLRKCESVTATGAASESYSRFSPEGEYEGVVRFVSDDLYYVTTNDIEANCTYYTYYNKAGSQRRKIKADHKYYFIDKFEELSYGEWVVPTQTFTLYKSGLNYVYTIDETGFPFVISERSTVTNDQYYSTSYSRGGFPINWTRMYTGIGGYEYAGEGVIKQVNNDVVSCRQRVDSRHDFTYGEYDTKRGLILYFNEEANTYIYSSFGTIERNRRSYTVGDTTVNVNINFDYAANLATKTRRDTYSDDLVNYEANYEYNWNKDCWVMLNEQIIEKTPQPEWKNFKVADVLDFSDVINPRFSYGNFSYITYNTANNIILGTTSRLYDTTRTLRELDPVSGELKTKVMAYVEYEDTPEAIARKEYYYTTAGVEQVSENRYELDEDGYISRYFYGYHTSDGFETVYADYRYGYNKDRLLVQLENIAGDHYSSRTERWAYDKPEDLIFNFNSVTVVEADSKPMYAVRGLTVTSDEGTDMTLYALDGRVVASSASGEVVAPVAGIYLLRIGSSVEKLMLR